MAKAKVKKEVLTSPRQVNISVLPKPALPKKNARKAKARSPKKRTRPKPGLDQQVLIACKSKNRLKTFCGALMGGLVPVCAFVTAHVEPPKFVSFNTLTFDHYMAYAVILSALVFSATTVYEFGRSGFRHTVKAAAFTVIVEVVMVFSPIWYLTWITFAYLIVINSISTGVNLTLRQSRL